MKKILIVTHSAANGGAERVSCTLANQFVKQGYDVTLYAVHSDNRQYYLDERVHYVFGKIKGKSKFFKAFERASVLKKFINENHFDVMFSFVYLEGAFLIGNRSLKKIYTLRNDPAHIYNKGLEKIIRYLINKDADRIVFQTPDARDYFGSSIRKKGVVIPNPIREGLPEWNKENHSNDIVAACRITPQKNLKMMIDAFTAFYKKNTDYRLVIYGKGELQQSFEDYVKTLGMEEHIIFPGFCDNIQEKMADAAMYISTSDYEGISNSMLEALAIGVPTICTDCPIGGARMFIESGVNGYLVPVGDTEKFADYMSLLINDKAKQAAFSMESVKICNTLSEKSIIDEWCRLI